MKVSVFRITLLWSLLFFSARAFSQENPEKPIPVFTADSLATGNYKDVLTSFFQLAFDNLVGPQKELKFTSNPYAIMMRGNPDLAVDTSYLRYSTLRNLNFGFGIRLDSNFRFNGFTSAINYAIINKRDYTVYREFLDIVENKITQFSRMTDSIAAMASELQPSNPGLVRRVREQWRRLNNRKEKFTISQVEDSVKTVLLGIAKQANLTEVQKMIEENSTESIVHRTDAAFESARNLFKNRLLWTVGISDTTYNDQFFFSNLVLSTQVLKGFTDPEKPGGLEFDLRGAFNMQDDSIRAGRDLRRSMLNFEGGLNYVRRSRKTDVSFFEVKMSASYNRVFNGLYSGERRELFTLNGTLRLRVFDDIWLPLQFKYDPGTGNVFGFLSVKANFTALKKALAQKIGS
jgi:hypothetical protein